MVRTSVKESLQLHIKVVVRLSMLHVFMVIPSQVVSG